MGFGKDLKNSHEGLIKLQDWELKLLETVKRFMTLRVKSDKEYASHLLNISQQVDKQDNSSQIHYISTVSKVINIFFFDSLTLFELGVVSLAQIINSKKKEHWKEYMLIVLFSHDLINHRHLKRGHFGMEKWGRVVTGFFLKHKTTHFAKIYPALFNTNESNERNWFLGHLSLLQIVLKWKKLVRHSKTLLVNVHYR